MQWGLSRRGCSGPLIGAVAAFSCAILIVSIGAVMVPECVAATPEVELPVFEMNGELDATVRSKVDRILVLKSKRRMLLLVDGVPVEEFSIALGGRPEGPKQAQGDGRTPEGLYRIDSRVQKSAYYRALHISYPNPEDAREAKAQGVEPGGAIMIHGLPNGLGLIGAAHRSVDWTDGCIAVTNDEMDEIWRRVEDGIPIEIRP